MSEEKKKSLSVRKYLEQLQELDISISQDLELLEGMKTHACSTGGTDYSRERVQTSLSGDRLCSDVSSYVVFDERITDEIHKFTEAKNQIISEIRGLHDKRYIQILFKVYVQFKSIRQASKEMKMSYRYTIQVHSQALKAFGETYTNLHYLT